jgi:hypothetical protein
MSSSPSPAKTLVVIRVGVIKDDVVVIIVETKNELITWYHLISLGKFVP